MWKSNKNSIIQFATKISRVVFVLGVISFLCFRAYSTTDPDFGWHIKIGEMLVSSGIIPKVDPFSYTMPSFPFISHEWLTEIYTYKVFESIGKYGLSFIFSIYLFFALFVASSNRLSRKVDKKVHKYALFLILPPSFVVILNYFGIRPQVQSWLLFSILFYVIFNPKLWNKFKLLLIPYIIFWANLHGSYALAVLTIILFIVFRFIRLRKIIPTDIIILATIIPATFINPYGPRIWNEIWLTASDGQLRWTIQEWWPSIFKFNPFLLIVATITSFLLWRYKSKFLIEEKVLYVVFLLQAISSTRHVPLWLILQIPFFVVNTNYLYEEIKPIPMAIERLTKMYKLFLAIVIILITFDMALRLPHVIKYSVSDTYPVEAINFLRENTSEGQILSPYNWGGYLIWKYPQKKYYIDGRMPSWRWDSAPENESSNAMRDYKDLLSGEIDYKSEFEKYGIDTVLWFAPKEETLYEKIDNIIYKYLEKFSQRDKNKKGLLESLEEDGWVSVYEDELAVIYRRE